MPKPNFFEIIKDIDKETFEIIGISNNDLALDERVCKLMDAGFRVQCETVDTPKFSHADVARGYEGMFKEEVGLYQRLQTAYFKKTGTHLF